MYRSKLVLFYYNYAVLDKFKFTFKLPALNRSVYWGPITDPIWIYLYSGIDRNSW